MGGSIAVRDREMAPVGLATPQPKRGECAHYRDGVYLCRLPNGAYITRRLTPRSDGTLGVFPWVPVIALVTVLSKGTYDYITAGRNKDASANYLEAQALASYSDLQLAQIKKQRETQLLMFGGLGLAGAYLMFG